MTEVLVTHVQPRGERKPGSVGVLLCNMECKVNNKKYFLWCLIVQFHVILTSV